MIAHGIFGFEVPNTGPIMKFLTSELTL